MKEATVKIKSIVIKGLFGLFNYDIELSNNVLILTGANGVGKTQILNIIYNLFEGDFIFFNDLVFEEITIELDSGVSILLIKEDAKTFCLFFNKELMFCSEGGGFEISDEHRLVEILNSINVYLIKEQRLLKEVFYNNEFEDEFIDSEKLMIEVVHSYAEELNVLILETEAEYFSVSRTLETTFPRRFLESSDRVISEQNFQNKIEFIKRKEDYLIKYGVYSKSIEDLLEIKFNKQKLQTLMMYLEDLEEKLSVYDDLVEKLDLFTTILNERRFTNKEIKIDKEKGFYFVTDNNEELQLSQLSSGEQHEVIILFELLFKTKQNSLVLIDEPELSLHITWQKEFLEDLDKIIKIQKFQSIIATHAPAIINDRWDLVKTLKK